MGVTLVAAVAANGVIGAAGGIPWRLPGEQRLFKELTMGHVLVMGRRTYESVGRPLPGRTTIVVTGQADWASRQRPTASRTAEPQTEVRQAFSVDEALDLAARLDPETFVVGGARVYADALLRADTLLITHVDARPDGDTFFPGLDWSQWREVDAEQHDGWVRRRYLRRPEGPSR